MTRLCFAQTSEDVQTFAKVHQNHLQANKKIFISIFAVSLLYFIADVAFYVSSNNYIDYPIFILAISLQLIRIVLFFFYLKVGCHESNKRFRIIEALFLVIFGISSIVSWELQIKLDPSKVYVVATEASWTFLYIHTLFVQSTWKAIVYVLAPLFGIYRTAVTAQGFNLGFIQAVVQMALILSSSYIEELWKKQKILQNISLEKTGQTLRTILNSLPDNIVILNLEGDIRFYNEYFGISFKLNENTTNADIFSKIHQVKPRERHLNLQKLQERYNFVRPTRKTARKSQSIRRESLVNPESFSSPLTQYLTDEFRNSNVKGTSVVGPKGERKQLFRARSARFSQLAPLKTLTEFFNSISYFKDLQEVMEFLSENVNIIRTYTEKERSFFIFDSKYITPEGVKSYEIKISLSNFDGEESFIMILRDTTLRDIIVTLEDHNNFKDSVLSSISHELKTPLNTNLNLLQLAIDAYNKIEKNGMRFPIWNSGSVENFSSLIGGEGVGRMRNDFKESYLIPAHKSGKLLESLINDIVDYSMLLARKFAITIKQKFLATSLEKIRYMCEFQALKKNVEFYVDVAPEINFKIGTDHKRLRQILTNLINNAIKFTNQGSVTLKIEPYCENQELVQFSVIDTGIGLDRIALERITTLLDSGNFLNKLNQESSGVGMGLIVSQLLAREIGPKAIRMSGLRIESKYGEGSKFWFVIENWKKGSEVLESKILDDTTSLQLHAENDHYSPASPKRTSLGRISLEVSRVVRRDGGTRLNVRSPIHERDDRFEDSFELSINDEFNDEEEIDEEDAQEIRDANLIKSMSSGRCFSPSIDSKSMTKQRLAIGSESPSAFLSSQRYLEMSPQATFLHLNPNLSIFNKTILIPTPPNEPADFQDALEQPSHICICAEILVVDDDMFNLFTMENLLNSLNFNIEKATNGKEAIEVVKKRSEVKCSELCIGFKLIFMDISMPVMDGFEATVKLREMMRNEEVPEVPIIACTAFVEDDKVTKCYDCGMIDKVSKPVNRNKLREVLRKYDVLEKQEE